MPEHFSTEQALPKDWLLSLHSTPFLDTERRPPIQKFQVIYSPVFTPAAGDEGKLGAHIFHFIETECLSGGPEVPPLEPFSLRRKSPDSEPELGLVLTPPPPTPITRVRTPPLSGLQHVPLSDALSTVPSTRWIRRSVGFLGVRVSVCTCRPPHSSLGASWRCRLCASHLTFRKAQVGARPGADAPSQPQKQPAPLPPSSQTSASRTVREQTSVV